MHISWRAVDIHHMLVLVGDRLGAHLAALAGRLGRGAAGADRGTGTSSVRTVITVSSIGFGRHRHRQHAVAHQHRQRLADADGRRRRRRRRRGRRRSGRGSADSAAPSPASQRRCSCAPASESRAVPGTGRGRRTAASPTRHASTAVLADGESAHLAGAELVRCREPGATRSRLVPAGVHAAHISESAGITDVLGSGSAATTSIGVDLRRGRAHRVLDRELERDRRRRAALAAARELQPHDAVGDLPSSSTSPPCEPR